jgi:hypothetical protein
MTTRPDKYRPVTPKHEPAQTLTNNDGSLVKTPSGAIYDVRGASWVRRLDLEAYERYVKADVEETKENE